MKRRVVEFAPEAREDLFALYEWISAKASPRIALGYIERIETYCNDFDLASQRGRSREDIRQGLRIIGFDRRLAIAFIVSDNTVTLLRLFYGGQNWDDDLSS
uniref:type II toxin-antitoxin system RelE/ParE family toxin n=1 Tax=Pararhizobium sp. IMCC3301 TaxID=3067904 RepID=UPI00274156BF|nr:type II toxin-antitoxin system RelE/ParE family toxin [Pararhizobium sp. IMCC3301]